MGNSSRRLWQGWRRRKCGSVFVRNSLTNPAERDSISRIIHSPPSIRDTKRKEDRTRRLGFRLSNLLKKSIKVKPLVAWAKNGMHDNQTRAIHERLLDITGVGQKIASLFLRDVAIRDKPTRAPDRYLLQPIDIWVRRCVERLNPNRDFKKNDIAIAKWITNHALEPEAVNQGMWYFANQVVRSEYRLQAALCDLGSARKLLKEHCRSLQRAASVWNRAGRVRP